MAISSDSVLIRFDKVQKAFGPKRIYDDLTLDVRRGESLTIVGGSGVGKSVLLKMLIGLIKPDSGAIHFEGQDIVTMDEEQLLGVRKRIAMMFQGAALFDSLSVGDNVAYPLREQLDLSESEIADRVAEKLKLVGLPDAAPQFPNDLSGGMKKRVALARAIVAEPEVILFDEPTAGLDPLNTRRVDDLIRSIQHELKITAIVVTHDLPSAYLVSDRIAMLHERKMIAVLSTQEFRSTSVPAIHEFVSAMNYEEQ